MTDHRSVNNDTDGYGRPTDKADHMQEVMLSFFDLVDEADLAGFPKELTKKLNELRVNFVDEFERRHPGRGSGRAVWR